MGQGKLAEKKTFEEKGCFQKIIKIRLLQTGNSLQVKMSKLHCIIQDFESTV